MGDQIMSPIRGKRCYHRPMCGKMRERPGSGMMFIHFAVLEDKFRDKRITDPTFPNSEPSSPSTLSVQSLNHYLINRDYADFVNLSTKLVDVDAAVVRMRAPLVELREKIEQFRGSVDVSLVAIKNGLKQRSEAASARETLELLLDTFHVVSKVEKLIKELPSVPSDWSNGDVNLSEKNPLSNGISVQPVENGTSVRETQSMLLERIASEMNRLKFHVTHAKDLPFIENMEKRIQNASLLVDASLGHCFVDGLEHRDATAIYNCVCAYAAIDNTKNAKETFRVTVVAPLIQKIIPHGSSAVAGSSGDGLENDYQLIKECIYKDCKFLLDISSAKNSGLHVFDFLANSILREVLFAIQKGKPGAFSPGRPTEFLKNYKSSLEFLAYLEGTSHISFQLICRGDFWILSY
ncbi:conserved oligomeric Golgi complex subunit [Trifolium repens]|nr:conserved oligomeric Golgi complex subunit [Trifolium repens]